MRTPGPGAAGSAPAGARPPGLGVPLAGWQALLVEGVAFSLPAARGEWLGYAVLAGAVGMGAAIRRAPRLQVLRAVLALGAALAVGHATLGLLQLAVAAAWWAGRERPVVVAAAALLGLAAPFHGPWAPPPPAPGTFDVVTWNVSRFRPEGWEFLLMSRFRVTPLDLLVLQEAGYEEVRPGFEAWRSVREEDRAGVARVAAELGLSYVWSGPPMGYRRSPHQSGLVVLSRHPFRPLEGTVPRGPDDPPPVFLLERPQGPVVVAPFHLWSPPLLDVRGRRAALRGVLERLPATLPRLAIGDTNLVPIDRHDLGPALGFVDAGTITRGYGGTWPSQFPVARLDAVYAAGLRVVDAATFATTASDHRPLWVRLAEPATRGPRP